MEINDCVNIHWFRTEVLLPMLDRNILYAQAYNELLPIENVETLIFCVADENVWCDKKKVDA